MYTNDFQSVTSSNMQQYVKRRKEKKLKRSCGSSRTLNQLDSIVNFFFFLSQDVEKKRRQDKYKKKERNRECWWYTGKYTKWVSVRFDRQEIAGYLVCDTLFLLASDKKILAQKKSKETKERDLVHWLPAVHRVGWDGGVKGSKT